MPDESHLTDDPEGFAPDDLGARLRSPEVAPFWLSAMVESADDAIIGKSLEGVIMSWNKGAERIFGYTAEEIVGRSVTTLIPHDLQDEEPAILARLRRGERIEHFETVHVRKDGTLVDISLTVSPIRDADGRIIGASKVARDITERKRTEEALRRSERELSDFFDNAVVGLHWVGADGKILRANRAELEMLGYAPEEYIGHHIAEFHADTSVIADILRRLQGGELLHEVEARLKCKDGSIRHVLIDSSVMWDGAEFVHTRCFTRDITERKRAEEALRRSEQFNRSIIESSRDCIMVLGLEGVILSISGNARHALILGDPAEALGKPWAEFWQGGDREAARAAVAAAAAGGTGSIVGYMPAGGEPKWWDVVISPILDAQGRPERLLAVSRDITERERLLGREREARREAEEASRLKDEFLATLSHELRTPLTAIIGWARMLVTGALDAEVARQAVEVISRNAESQKQIVDDVLDASRIVTGKLRIEPEDVDLPTVVREALDAVSPAAAAKGVELLCDFDPLAATALGDPQRLRQVIWNLLSNAVKFTDRGGRVRVVTARSPAGVRLTISDTGQGIAAEFLPYVFDRFRQADSSTTRRHGGLGLGLSIVRHLVEAHGGSVHAYSAGPGQGASFTVELPLPADAPDASGDGRQAFAAEARPAVAVAVAGTFRQDGSAPKALSGVRVLVVEDDADTLELMAVFLRRNGAEVTAALSAGEALKALAACAPDVIVSDVGMPDMDGYELMRRVRSLRGAGVGAVPAIALTAYASEADRVRALNAGYQRHMAKPMDPAELLEAISELARRAKTL